MAILLSPLKTGQTVSLSTVTPGMVNTITVDYVPATTVSLKWMLTLQDNVGKLVTYEILVQNKNGIPTFNRSATVGDRILHFINVDVSAGQLRLRVTNLEGTNITARVIKFLIY